MMKADEEADRATRPHDATQEGGVGDLETAGETTAAEMIGGEPDTRPVGLDSIADIKIPDERD